MSALCIPLESVKEKPGPFRLVAEPAWWEGVRGRFSERPVAVREAFELELSGYRMGSRLLFRGEARGTLELPCGRCAELYGHEFRQLVEVLLEPARAGEEVEEGGLSLDPDEPGVGRYAGKELDFSPLLLEMLALEWPMQPLCREGCRGLCPVCGANHNERSCGCASAESTRPLAALGQLLDESTRNRR